MIIKNSTGTTPSIELTIGNVEVDYISVQKIELNLKENEHDLLSIQMSGLPVQALTDYIKAPVKYTMVRGASQSHEFVGEIAQVVPHSKTRSGSVNNSPIQSATINCMGASYRMRGVTSKVWGDVTLPHIATTLAKKYQFSLDVPNDKYVYRHLSQVDKSDWAFLNQVCDIAGYSMTLHGTHLHIWDPYKATGRQISFHKLSTVKTMGGDPNPVPGAILSFTGSFESYTPSEYVTSVLDVQGNISTVSTNQLNESFGLGKEFVSPYPSRTAITAMSVEEALVGLRGVSRNVNPFYAKMEVVGLVGVLPGGLVEVDKYDAGIDGLWYVSGANHQLGGAGGLKTDLHLLRDSTNEEPPIIYNTQRFKEPATAVFRDDKWASSSRRINVYT
jgi:hypothetical protein